MTTKVRLQIEVDRLRAALADILDVCAQEKPEPAAWPRDLGAVQCIAREALSGPAALPGYITAIPERSDARRAAEIAYRLHQGGPVDLPA